MTTRNKNDFAPRPPMGWNSYDYYDTTVNEEQVRANARFMAEHLKEFGYEYIVIDIEWYSKDAGTKRPEIQYIPFGDDEIDTYGRFQPAPNRFPSSADGTGFTKLAEYVHSLGLKFGIHIMRGIPRTAAERHLPITDQGMNPTTTINATAAEVAHPNSICVWNPDMYGVRPTSAGQAYYDGLIQMYADWGVDYIKCDDICDSKLYREAPEKDHVVGGPVLPADELFNGWAETEMIHRAIMKTGRDIVLSLSPGPAHIDRAHFYAENANMWRITDDFWDEWPLLKNMFRRCEMWEDHVKPGCYPDCDMLTVGQLAEGFGNGHRTKFTLDEQKTMMTLWCIFGAPLMIGTDLTTLEKDHETYALLTDKAYLQLLDGKHQGRQCLRTDDKAVWQSTNLKTGKVDAIALFNLADEAQDISYEDYHANVPAHGVKLINI